MRKWLKINFAAGFLAILCLLTLSSNSTAADSIKIGVLYSMTGPGAATGKAQLDGVQLAMKQINGQGGLIFGGKKVKVEVVVLDDATRSDVAAQRYREFLKQGLTLIVGGTFAHVSKALNDQARSGEALVMVTNGIEEKVLSKKEKAPYYLSSMGAVEAVGRIAADYVAQTYRPGKVMLFLPDYAYGRGVFLESMKTFAKYPDIKVDATWTPVGFPDYGPSMERITKARPDVVMIGHWGPDAVNVLNKVYASGLKNQTRIFYISTPETVVADIAPEAVEGISMGAWWYHDLAGFKDIGTKNATDALNAQWKQEYIDPPNFFGMFAYIGIMEVLRGIGLASSTEPAKVYKALMDHPDFESVKGPATWRVDGRPAYRFGKFVTEGKGIKSRVDAKWDYARVVDAYEGEALCLPLKDMGW